MFVDEAQDMDTLEMALIRKWALEAGALVVVGDPDQCLYQWRGADPRVFYSANIPDSHAHVLKQSYRVPRSVHRLAMDWISQDPERVPVEYYPRDAEGVVRRSSASWALPETLVRDAQEQIEAGRTVMFLASCSYMLFPLIACLHRHGLPYHNPYRKTAWKWNPLQTARGRTTSAERLLAFVELAETGQYSSDSLVRWTDITLKKPTFKERGEDWLEFVDTRWVTMDDLDLILSDEAMDAALMGDTNWLYQNLLAQRKRGMAYPITIYDAHGRDMLMKTPQITVGTIHSVKGGEADVVYLFPDLSGAGAAEWDRERSPIRRLFYVGMTRAKEELILCEPKDNNAVNL
jgi:superfamily I DNA/RNA helicase